MKKIKQSQSKHLVEKSDYWKWNNNLCHEGIYCKKTNCPYAHPIVNGAQLKGVDRTYTDKCSMPGNDKTLNSYGRTLLSNYEKICPAKKGHESTNKFWNNYCDRLDNPSDLVYQGTLYQDCADARELFGKTCSASPEEHDISHFATKENMSKYAKDCRNKVRAINFNRDRQINNPRQTKRSVIDALVSARAETVDWASQFQSRGSSRGRSRGSSRGRSRGRSRSRSDGYSTPRNSRTRGRKTTRGPTGAKSRKNK